MKTYFYLTICLFMFHACRSPEKLIEKEQYDLVLKRASLIFKYKKAPALKWVMAAEQAFALANEKDITWIAKCQKKGGIFLWKNIYYTAQKIDKRQNKIAKHSPIIAETGYPATFDFFDAKGKMQEAQSWIANLYFSKAKNKMKKARAGSKKAALHTISLVDSALIWRNDIYQAQALRQEATAAATVKLAVFNHFNEKYSRASIDISAYLHDYLSRFSHPYLDIKVDPSDNFESDYYLFVYPTAVYIGNAHETVDETHYSKEVVTSCEIVKEWNATDSVWVERTVETTATIYGTLIEYEQRKTGGMDALITVEDAHTYHLFSEKEIHTSYYFSNDYKETNGDEDAIEHVFFKGSWAAFPSDWEMESYMSRAIASDVKRYIKKYNWWFE